jgi:hypothetical protein
MNSSKNTPPSADPSLIFRLAMYRLGAMTG